jgi:hypothetical protein
MPPGSSRSTARHGLRASRWRRNAELETRMTPTSLRETDCTCGVYASKTREHLRGTGYERLGIRGEVHLWGTVVEHEFGYRSEFAYPKTLFLPPDLIPSGTAEMESRLETLAAYGTDVFIGGGGRKIPLCRKGSGFHAAGLDYLIGKRTQYYVRR